jgi:hypothetical protein
MDMALMDMNKEAVEMLLLLKKRRIASSKCKNPYR